MEKIVEQGLLYDFYGELLTDHQKKVYEEAVYDDMSLSEIAEDIGISRQGVHDLIKRCDKILHDYEHKLHLVEKFTRIKESVREINQISEQAITENSELQRIRQLSDDILREL
ncbi:MAG: YlxM family DNA-binding protein [Lachnospiraceae bacterium]|nr:YlxM family DNA-binding protein [Lachnospiraceae bacterium]